MKPSGKKANDDLRAEYDLHTLLKGGARGKYAKRYHAGTNLMLIEPKIHSQFPAAKNVNDALCLVIDLRWRSLHRPDAHARKAFSRELFSTPGWQSLGIRDARRRPA